MPKYRTCPSCLRHTARTESACAHCGATASNEASTLPGIGRSGALAAALGVSLALGGCGGKEEPTTPAVEEVQPDAAEEAPQEDAAEEAEGEEKPAEDAEEEGAEEGADEEGEDDDEAKRPVPDPAGPGEIQPAVYGGPPVEDPLPPPTPPEE